MDIVMFIVSVILAYLIGSFPTSYILTRTLRGADIRDLGSGNAGATNVLRNVGKLPAIITLVVDILKGFFVVTVFADFFYQFECETLIRDFYVAFLGLVVICGHIWSIFLKFRGGKGVATTIGVGAGMAPLVFLPSLIIWVVIFALTGYVSLASIISLIAFPIFAALFNAPFYTTIISAVIVMIVIVKHRSNITRLIKGEESKTVVFKKKNK